MGRQEASSKGGRTIFSESVFRDGLKAEPGGIIRGCVTVPCLTNTSGTTCLYSFKGEGLGMGGSGVRIRVCVSDMFRVGRGSGLGPGLRFK